MYLTLDANDTSINVTSMVSSSDISPIYHADNMEDGDHQFYGFMNVSGPSMEIDYFECVIPLLHFVPRTIC